ncbi:Na+/H+ antiporter NhaA [Nibrella saemangeumensis]|uniref:Na(+)/H(+) antiporter NhaA n=1 Tax=Nibrella saemangeumensis TaxID=1084526 RepID=A0ABP8MBH4_9BACT
MAVRKRRSKIFSELLKSGQAAGIILIICTATSLFLANSVFAERYLAIWETKIGFRVGTFDLTESLSHWINDALMAVFFLLVGLEIKREMRLGELSNPRSALLPLMAAIGGMALPAGLYAWANYGLPTSAGTGIPMATDIAFALGILSLLGSRAPFGLKIFLMALAVIDDLGAIAVIALFYSKSFSLPFFLAAMAVFGVLIFMNRIRVKSFTPFLWMGLLLWFFMLESGVHATVAGVLLAFTVPLGRGYQHSPLIRLEHKLHKPVNLFILPLFALANTGIILESSFVQSLTTPDSQGILLGLLLGKPVGVLLMTWLAVQFRIGSLPEFVGWRHIIGAGFLSGIGFTMSIFIAILAFDNPDFIKSSKITVLTASAIAGIIGYIILRFTPYVMNEASEPQQPVSVGSVQ